MHLCAEKIAASVMLKSLGEVGANFSLQLSSRTQFTKTNNEKVIAENQCEKHKKTSLDKGQWLSCCVGFCLFDLFLYVPSTIFQLNRDGSSWV